MDLTGQPNVESDDGEEIDLQDPKNQPNVESDDGEEIDLQDPKNAERERTVFKYAINRDEEEEDSEEIEPDRYGNFPIEFKLDVSMTDNGKDVKLTLGFHSGASEPIPVSINVDVKAVSKTGSADIQSEQKEETLQPGQDLSVPVVVLFSKYGELMQDEDMMRIFTKVLNTNDGSEVCHTKRDVAVVDQPIAVKVMNDALVSQELLLDLFFQNPLSKTLKGCSFTLSGSGLYEEKKKISLADIGPKSRVQAQEHLVPKEAGKKTLVVDFNCSALTDLKKSNTIDVK